MTYNDAENDAQDATHNYNTPGASITAATKRKECVEQTSLGKYRT